MENLQQWLTPPLIWFIIGLVLLILEFITPGLVILFFGIGAWIVSVICLLSEPLLNTQLTLFTICSLVLLGSLRKWVKLLYEKRWDTSDDKIEEVSDFLNQRAMVKEKISPNRTGRVEFRGTNWDAESNEVLEVGTTVNIINKRNITLIVKSQSSED